MSLIEFCNVKKGYRLGAVTLQALRGINLQIGTGEFVAVWGPSGSGKSTFCNLAGLIDDCSAGSVSFRGVTTSTLTDNQRSELRSYHIGFVFQSFNLVPVFTALENVLLPLQLRGITGKKLRDKGLDLLATLGLETHARNRPDELSGGQQQRVAIARALIGDPSLVIADEPTANLDTENARAIIAIMRDMNRQNGTTFLFSTHDERLLDRVERKIHLRDGLVITDESGLLPP
ncbi:MAG: ABC transporter ATP-binding protein [Candidatus Competibacteraceae bacterium]|nr:ABC transporter ATP-binding protein [Candidatus Competibacteraceae bacterium]